MRSKKKDKHEREGCRDNRQSRIKNELHYSEVAIVWIFDGMMLKMWAQDALHHLLPPTVCVNAVDSN